MGCFGAFSALPGSTVPHGHTDALVTYRSGLAVPRYPVPLVCLELFVGLVVVAIEPIEQ